MSWSQIQNSAASEALIPSHICAKLEQAVNAVLLQLQQTFEHPWQDQLLLPMLSLAQEEMQGRDFYDKSQPHSCTLGRAQSHLLLSLCSAQETCSIFPTQDTELSIPIT